VRGRGQVFRAKTLGCKIGHKGERVRIRDVKVRVRVRVNLDL
jgi:hypothetical protein